MKDNIIIYLDDAVDLDFNISIHMVYNTYKITIAYMLTTTSTIDVYEIFMLTFVFLLIKRMREHAISCNH